ncbi:hypothetical protein [Paracoccus zhejiangensis]|uniref:Uncharacterized protein n=1 Tax=Paracoccus zhejiangensis TaxID=1077935 RepID=A0A2H5F356_9RHOB|nr:hypothetical protein [Paracoccus zhejiangensis]AUH65980.1 hypothetical protein CX676_18955 [Paracoccus zhejiangensis]
MRLFAHVVEHLAACRQPDLTEIEAVGYLMRTTAVYGSGKFGAADRSAIAGRPEMAAPFQAEMLSVWLIRQFTTDLVEHLAKAQANAASWSSVHPVQQARLRDLRADFDRIGTRIAQFPGDEALPWNALWQWGETTLTPEGQEALLALLLEPHGELVDDLARSMSLDEAAEFHLDGRMTVATLRRVLETHYDWAVSIDFTRPENQARFWYVSEEKQEPRLGRRQSDADSALEQPLCVARLAAELAMALRDWPGDTALATFLLRHPQHRFMVRRAQITARRPYAEIRDNLISEDMLPIDLMRCKLAYFGASHFDPRSDKWVRICLFQNAPNPLVLSTERGS